jgi:hypothetical protein
MEMIPIVAIIMSFGTAILIVYFITRAKNRNAELQAEMQSKLIDRFGSAPELVTFLQSPAGRDFVKGVQSTPRNATRERILGGFTRSIVLTALGASFVFLTFWEDSGFVIPGAIILSLGIGYFLATIVSWRLSAKLSAEPDTIQNA